jgi:beta-lactamase regulating signal transducer with metallopeptidase domain
MFTKLFADQAIAWLLTYLLHSTFLLGLAWLVSKPLGRWSVAAEEAVWKLALVGALFTASLQFAAGFEPAAGRWEMGAAASVQQEVAQPRVVPSAAPISELVQPSSVFRSVSPSVTVRPAAARALPAIPALALGVWALVGGILLAAYGRSHLRLRSRLRNRPRVVGGTLLSRLRLLSAETELGGEVRLSCSSRVPVPVALGLARSEICVPPRALAGLSDEQQEGMLAHELAHLVRRDPLWLVVSHLVSCVFFFQPLNWVARRRLREISEILSDEWAVSRTGRPLSLAGCLAEVAAWSARGRELPVPVMADRPSHLARRIRRLLDESRSPESPARRIWMGAAMVVLLIAVVAAAPAVSTARQEASAQPAQLTAASPAAAEAAEVAEDPEPPEAAEPKEHAVAEQRVEKHAGAQEEADHDADTDVDFDTDDVNLDFDADEIAERATEAATAALDAVDGQLEQLSEVRPLSDADRKKLEREIERTNQEIEGRLRPRMEQLSRELSEKISREMPTPEMGKIEEQMRALAEQMRPSGEEMERMRAQMDAEMKKLRADGELNREDREKIVAEARRMAREMRPSEEQRKAMEDLRRQHQELSRQFMGEHREEIEKATREMREEIQQEMQAAREEIRRSMEQQRKVMQEERREHERQRQEMRKDRDRDHKREHGDAKPPKAPNSGGC